MTWKPHVTVAAVIEENDRFLLVEEDSEGRRVLNQPAGHLEDGESLIDAVIRETREESACLIRPEYISGLYRWVLQPQQRTYLRVSFAGSIIERFENQPLDTDVIQTHWMSYDEILANRSRLRSPLVLACIDDYRAGHQYPLTLLKDLD